MLYRHDGKIANSCLVIRVPMPTSPGLLSPNRLLTNPGCRQLAVTPVPESRRASSRVNRMLHSLEREYARRPL